MVHQGSTLSAGKIPAGKIPELSQVCEDCEAKVENPKKSEAFLMFVESYNNVPARQQLFRALVHLENQGKKLLEGFK